MEKPWCASCWAVRCAATNSSPTPLPTCGWRGRGEGGGGGGGAGSRGQIKLHLAAGPGVEVGEHGGDDGEGWRHAPADLLVDELPDLYHRKAVCVYAGLNRFTAGIQVLPLLRAESEGE
jgi:hypothetical protein